MEECKLCHKSFKNLNGLSAHITKSHKDVSQQEYYDKYLRPKDHKNICPTCGNPTEFSSIGYGYKIHCNKDCSNKDPKIIQQRHDTINELYGGHAFCFTEIQEKCRQTVFDNYGVINPYQIKEVRDKAHSAETVEKRNITMKNNNTFKTSKQEDSCYDILKQIFPDIKRNYITKDYPYKCDFYIPSINCYIECNFHWTHGRHWFDDTNSDDIITYNNWKNRNTKYFQNALYTWTVRDVEKRQCAKEKNLNYIVLWSIDDFQKWKMSNFEIRKDF